MQQEFLNAKQVAEKFFNGECSYYKVLRLTREGMLPAKKIGKSKEMKDLTEKTMMGKIPFFESFTSRIEILKDIDVSEVADMISKISLNEKL